jgi:hypothetical protein
MPGPQPLPDDEKRRRGTLRPCRVQPVIEVVEPASLPAMPSWLTPAGEEAWAELLPQLLAAGLVSELDSSTVGMLANLSGALTTCWRAGEVPPIMAITEHRRLCTLFGIAGERSRVGVRRVSSEAPNPFAKYGRRFENNGRRRAG